MSSRKLLLAAIGYIVATFVIAAGWHLVLFKHLYDELGMYTRKDPIIPLGVASMILQSGVMAYLFPLYSTRERPVLDGLTFGLLMGVFMGSYGVLAEGAKQQVSSLSTWIVLEGVYFLLQFSIVGMVIGWIYGRGERR